MKIFFACVLGLMLVAANSYAEDKKDDSFWGSLKGKVEKLAPKKKNMETTAVGGVRGAKDTSSESLYWKGEEKKVELPDEEVVAFRAALEDVATGKKDEAAVKFDKFVQAYPKSVLKDDALRAIEELKSGK